MKGLVDVSVVVRAQVLERLCAAHIHGEKADGKPLEISRSHGVHTDNYLRVAVTGKATNLFTVVPLPPHPLLRCVLPSVVQRKFIESVVVGGGVDLVEFHPLQCLLWS